MNGLVVSDGEVRQVTSEETATISLKRTTIMSQSQERLKAVERKFYVWLHPSFFYRLIDISIIIVICDAIKLELIGNYGVIIWK